MACNWLSSSFSAFSRRSISSFSWVYQDSIKSTLRSRHKNDLARIYAAATEVCIVSAAENGFMPEYIDVARKMGEKAALRRLTDTALDLLKSMVGGTGK